MTRTRSGLARAGEVALWWVLLWGMWTLTLSTVTLAESVVAVVATLPAAASAVAARRAERVGWRPALSWLRWAPVWGVAVVADTGRVLWAAARRRTGEFTEVDISGEPGQRRAARRAFAALTLTSTPGTLVVDVPPDDNMAVHSLTTGPPYLERKVAE